MRETNIVLYLSDDEYNELLSLPEEEELFILCGIRIIRDGRT